MDGAQLKRHFERIGAALEIEWLAPPPRRGWAPAPTTDFTLDVRQDKKETFVLALRRERASAYDWIPLHVEPGARHLVLMVKTNLPVAEPKQKFLCGHDERHWFIATLPRAVTTVREAYASLMPEPARVSLALHRVCGDKRYRRHNAGYLRQGEWFFVPQPAFRLERGEINHKNEPIRRNDGGQAHRVENIVRRNGVRVYVSRTHPNGLTEQEYKSHLLSDPRAAYVRWQLMVRDAEVYARGAVRHPDHKTLVLHDWHRVWMSSEKRTQALVFLD